jgi:mono/diheme cytochrome c family protein
MKTHHLMAVLTVSALAAIACSKSEGGSSSRPTTNHEPEPASETTSYTGKIDMDKAQVVFNERCAACHGTEGKGNGPASGALNPKPRNYTDKAWQAAVTDAQLRKTITLGGAAVGKSPIMPASPDLDEKPEVVEGLVKIVRKFGS